MSDDIRCFMVVDLQSGDVCLDYKTEKTDRRNFAQEAMAKVTAMAKQQQLVTEQTRMGMIFAETDDELAYLIFVAPDYPERVAEQLVDKHARAVESMASDGTFDSTWGAGQSGGTKKAYAAVCKTLATEYEGGDKVSQVMREVDQVKGENINQAMSNLESTEELNKDPNQETKDLLIKVIEFFDDYDQKQDHHDVITTDDSLNTQSEPQASTQLTDFLVDSNFKQYEQELVNRGAATVGDLYNFTESDFTDMGMTDSESKSLLKKAANWQLNTNNLS